MSLPKEGLLDIDSGYLSLIEAEKKIASESNNLLMLLENNAITEACQTTPGNHSDNDPKYLTVYILNEHYRKSVLYHDNDVLNKIRELMDFKKQSDFNLFRRWYISIDDLLNELNNIDQVGIQINKQKAHFAIRCYLRAKFSHQLMLHYLSVKIKGITMTKLEHDAIKLKMKIKYAKGGELSNYKTPFDDHFYSLYKKIRESSHEDTSKPLSDIKHLKRMFAGKVEDIWLRIVVDDCLTYDKNKMTQTCFFSHVYNLFQLIVQDRRSIDYKTYDNEKRQSYKSFESYKCKVVKQIIYPKRKS